MPNVRRLVLIGLALVLACVLAGLLVLSSSSWAGRTRPVLAAGTAADPLVEHFSYVWSPVFSPNAQLVYYLVHELRIRTTERGADDYDCEYLSDHLRLKRLRLADGRVETLMDWPESPLQGHKRRLASCYPLARRELSWKGGELIYEVAATVDWVSQGSWREEAGVPAVLNGWKQSSALANGWQRASEPMQVRPDRRLENIRGSREVIVRNELGQAYLVLYDDAQLTAQVVGSEPPGRQPRDLKSLLWETRADSRLQEVSLRRGALPDPPEGEWSVVAREIPPDRVRRLETQSALDPLHQLSDPDLAECRPALRRAIANPGQRIVDLAVLYVENKRPLYVKEGQRIYEIWPIVRPFDP
jgi:hypothetical protein